MTDPASSSPVSPASSASSVTAPAPGPRPPASPGDALADVDTPALLVDLAAFEANLAAVHERARQAGVRVRAHAKAHKSPDIARRQLEAGGRGICVQKLGEAEVFADAGIDDILVTNELIGMAKAARAARLARRIRLGVCVDHPLQVAQLGEATRQAQACLDVLVELDVGQGRCGVVSPEAVLALARQVASQAPQLRFAGLHAYHGGAQHLRSEAERGAAIGAAAERVKAVLRVLAAAGVDCPSITGGGTGSFACEARSGVYTEVQPGSYVLMDADYAANQPDAGVPPLRQALFGWCSVISRREAGDGPGAGAGHAVLDGGLKAFSVDSGLPQVLHPGWRVESISDEHTVIVPGPGAAALAVGDKLRLVPGHCDPTVNLHDWLVAVRGDVVAEVWRVSARGAVF